VFSVPIESQVNSIEYQNGYRDEFLAPYDKLVGITIDALQQIAKNDKLFNIKTKSMNKISREIYTYADSVPSPKRYTLRIRRVLFENETLDMDLKFKDVDPTTFVPPPVGPLADVFQQKFEMDVHCNTTRVSHTTKIMSSLLLPYMIGTPLTVYEMQQWFPTIVEYLQIPPNSVWIPKKTYDWEMQMDISINSVKLGSTLSKFFPNLESFFEDNNEGAGDWSWRIKADDFSGQTIKECNSVYKAVLGTGIFYASPNQCVPDKTYPDPPSK